MILLDLFEFLNESICWKCKFKFHMSSTNTLYFQQYECWLEPQVIYTSLCSHWYFFLSNTPFRVHKHESHLKISLLLVKKNFVKNPCHLITSRLSTQEVLDMASSPPLSSIPCIIVPSLQVPSSSPVSASSVFPQSFDPTELLHVILCIHHFFLFSCIMA